MKRKKKNKREYPRKSCKGLIKTLFWAGFFGVLGMGALSMARTVSLDVRTQAIQAGLRKQENIIAGMPKMEDADEGGAAVNEEGAGLYAADFAREFYTWGFGGEKVEERNGRLQAYLADGLDASGGYDISGLETASSVDSCEVWKLEADGEKLDVVVKVGCTLSEQENKKKEIVEKPVAQATRYLLVPLITDGKVFRVRALPHFVQAPGTLEYAYQPDQPEAGLLVTDEAVCSEIGDFMNTFFKVAVSGTTEELAYYTASEEVESMSGIYSYVGINEAVVYQEGGEGSYKVYVEASMRDELTQAGSVLKAVCVLKRENGRYIVSEIRY